jgi:phosphotransferase system HPr (HPr) family protein
MNSIRYRIVNPWGVHARSAAFITSVANVCAKDWEVVATVRGQEGDAKSIMSLMMLATSYQIGNRIFQPDAGRELGPI